jgi:hypothetical protein
MQGRQHRKLPAFFIFARGWLPTRIQSANEFLTSGVALNQFADTQLGLADMRLPGTSFRFPSSSIVICNAEEIRKPTRQPSSTVSGPGQSSVLHFFDSDGSAGIGWMYKIGF